MTRIKRAALFLGILTACFVSTLALAQSGVSPLGITPTPVPSGLTVTIATDKSSYVIGESVTITYTVNQPAYIYILDIQPDGVVRQVFPNQYSMSNYVGPGGHVLPDAAYRFTVYPPTGLEQLEIFASPTPLNLVTSYQEPFPMVGSTPGAAAKSVQAQILGILPEPQVATAWTSFQITSYPYTPPSSYYYPVPTPPSGCYTCYPPFPGYPGATWYWNGTQWVFGTPPSGAYWYFGTDGKWHLRITFHFNFGG